MRQRTWKEQSRHISDLERRNRALLADASGAKEILRLEKAIADRDAAIAKLEERLVAKDAAIESLKAANSLLSVAGRKSKAETQDALRRCARLEKANASLESRLHDAEDRAWENSEKRREAEERAKAAERLLDSERRDHAAQITDKDEQIARLLQKLSKEKARDFLYEVTGGRLDVSSGSMTNFVRQMERRTEEDVARIAAGVAASPVIESDAPFTRSEGKRSYIYVFAGEGGVCYMASDAKGDKPLAESPLALAGGATIVHDHDKSYYRYGARHAECNAHVLRYLKGVAECEPGQVWASKLRALLTEANEAAKDARARGEPVGADAYAAIRGSYVGILEDAIAAYEQAMPENPKYRPDGYPLAKRMLEYADEHLLFLLDASVPYTNNLSERLLWVSKGKMKQSGGFRSTANGERPYCAYLTVTETAKARGGSPYAAVRSAFSS